MLGICTGVTVYLAASVLLFMSSEGISEQYVIAGNRSVSVCIKKGSGKADGMSSLVSA